MTSTMSLPVSGGLPPPGLAQGDRERPQDDKRRSNGGGGELPGHARAVHPVLALLALSLALSAFVGCRAAPAEGSTVQVRLEVLTPHVVGPATVEVKLTNPDGQPVEGASVTVRGDMTHGGMAPEIVKLRSASPGVYRTEEFNFTMAGEWTLKVQAELPGGAKVERSFEIRDVMQK